MWGKGHVRGKVISYQVRLAPPANRCFRRFRRFNPIGCFGFWWLFRICADSSQSDQIASSIDVATAGGGTRIFRGKNVIVHSVFACRSRKYSNIMYSDLQLSITCLSCSYHCDNRFDSISSDD